MRAVAVVSFALGLAVVPAAARAQPSSEPPIRITGNNLAPPTKIKDVNAVFPPDAQRARVGGVVIIEATIGEDGKVRDEKLLRSIPLLDQAALDAVKQWEYTPTIVDGKPRAVIMTVTVNFAIQGVPPVDGAPVQVQPPATPVATAPPAPGAGMIRLFAYRPQNTGAFVVFDVTQMRATGQPHWMPDAEPPPLTVADAARIGRAWLAGRYPQVERFDLQGASLTRSRRPPNIDFWYYQLNFFAGTPQIQGPLFAVVLADGTIVEPTDPAAAAAPSSPQQVFQQGAAGVTMPRTLRTVQPMYTEEALRRKIAGTVLVQGIVGLDGTLHDLRVARSLDPVYGLDAEALKAAAQWLFAPGTKDGQPVQVTVSLEITFSTR